MQSIAILGQGSRNQEASFSNYGFSLIQICKTESNALAINEKKQLSF